MARKLIIVAVTALVFALPAVLSADVRVDFDKRKDFTQYRTFSVEIGDLVTPDGELDEHNTLAEGRIREAVADELGARGIEPADAGELIVRISGRDTERSEVLSRGWSGHPRYSHWRWGYWRSPYRYWPGYYDDVWTRRFLEGSLTVDVLERQTGALVYRARVTEEVHGDRDKQVKKAIDKAFKKFPVKEIDD